MNPDSTPKTRSVWPTLRVKIPKLILKWGQIDTFKPAEPHSKNRMYVRLKNNLVNPFTADPVKALHFAILV